MIFHLSSKSIQDFANHTQCRLGKWYYEGEGHACFSQLPGYSDIEYPHTVTHHSAINALTAFSSGDSEIMLKEIEKMEAASSQILISLERMAKSAEANADLLCHSR